MSWWNPFSTEANNGKSTEQLDAERAQLDAQRAAKKEEQAQALDLAGYGDEAQTVRQAQAEWTRQHNDNLAREAASLEETPWDAFSTELDARASALGNAGDAGAQAFSLHQANHVLGAKIDRRGVMVVDHDASSWFFNPIPISLSGASARRKRQLLSDTARFLPK